MGRKLQNLHGFINTHIFHPITFSRNLNLFLGFVLILLYLIIPMLSANQMFGYEKIKVIFFLLMVTISGAGWFIGSFVAPSRYEISWTLINKTALGFILILTVTSLTGINYASSFFGNDPYFQGLIVYLYLYLLYLMVKTVPVRLKVWIWIFSASSVIVSFFALRDFVLLHFLNISIPTFSGRVVSSFGQPNLYSGFILLCLPFSLFLFGRSGRFGFWGRIGMFAVLLVQVLAIGASFSRASILLIVPLLLLWAVKKFHDRLVLIIGGIGVVGVIIAMGLSVYFSSGVIYTEIVAPLENRWMGQNSPERRYYIWYIIFDSIKQRPLQGYGLDNLVWVFGKSYNPNSELPPFYHTVKDLVVDRSHNYSLDLIVFSGILGFLSWIGLIWALLRKDKSKLLAVWLLIYLLWIQFQIQGIVHLMMFWMVVALIDKGESLDLA